jgi:tRNA (guanine37-N1)-methyltransferase
MRQISFITIHPKIIEAYKLFGVFRSAESKAIASTFAIDLRDYAADKHGSVDDTPYGGGDGMVLRPDCLNQALEAARAKIGFEKSIKVISTSPTGKLWTQEAAKQFSNSNDSVVFICGRFAGVDQRFLDSCVDEEYSLGDVVYAGGELPALLMAESFLRLVPGVLGDEQSTIEDSFGMGLQGLLEYPSYTRPVEWQGQKVPDILLSGDHKAIREWRLAQSTIKTRERRPDLLRK